ncbi:hypothetical protein P8C59_001327 [Phyllachora maydis]|uniref:Uncharacterized protein n=2 Tax=Phyllachora maydis TaxID=1825666 RepID=A0AAD9HY62_9PEZI|nr:hypothetical protein P8C59_001327 [Phyllachora maydis]
MEDGVNLGEAGSSDEDDIMEIFDGVYRRRHEIEMESDDSVFEPSDEGEANKGPEEKEEEEEEVKEEEEEEDDDDDEDEDDDDDEEDEEERDVSVQMIKPEPGFDEDLLPSTPRTQEQASRKRSFDTAFAEDLPFARAKGPLCTEYLNLLNEDIQDASAQYLPFDSNELGKSQLGVTVWTSAEKDLFFEALGRLGADDTAGIASRIGSKCELEVSHYLKLLRDGAKQKEKRPDAHEIDVVPADLPAACELSQACCQALENAADALALRQESYEENREQVKWGPDRWLVTSYHYSEMENYAAVNMRFMELFRSRAWLMLSNRMFMNAAFAEGNWHCISEERPSIRATALEDFYSLAVSITRRLIAATIYTAESRIRSMKSCGRGALDLVWDHDVRAAALSVGLKTNSTEFWAKSARRLRLNVVLDDKVASGVEDEDLQIMSFDAVEQALGLDQAPRKEEEEEEEEAAASPSSLDTPPVDGRDDGADEAPAEAADSEAEAVRCEANEIMQYTALDDRATLRNRQTVEGKIRLARAHDAYADALDLRASCREEKRLWAMLGRDAPPPHLARSEMPAPPAPSAFLRDNTALDANPREWRDQVRYVAEWEAVYENNPRPGPEPGEE